MAASCNGCKMDGRTAVRNGVDNKTVAIQRAKSSGEIPQMDSPRAVRLALELRPSLSDRAIAQHCGVSQPFVGKVRLDISSSDNGYQMATRVATRNGVEYPIRTAGINEGRRAQATESPVEPSDPWEDSEGEDEPAAAPVKAARP